MMPDTCNALFSRSVSPRFATYLHVYLVSLGIDPELVFKKAGVPFNSDQEYNRPLTPAEASCLFNTAAKEANDDYFGLHMGAKFCYESAGLSILAMTSAPDVEQGLLRLVHYGKFIDNALVQRFIRHEESFAHSFRLLADAGLPLRHLQEYMVTLVFQTIRIATRQDCCPLTVAFAHTQTMPLDKYAEFFGTRDIRFEQERCSLHYPNSLLSTPLVTANKLLHSLIVNSLKTYLSEKTHNEFTDVVCREMMRLTSKEVPSIEAVAANLSVSVRTLRRKLKQEGYTFQAVKQLALERKSKHLLEETNLPLGEISYEVGYSEVSAFCRAFRRWTGHTPQEFRQSHPRIETH